LQLLGVLLQGTPDVVKMIPDSYHPLLHFTVSALQALGWYVQRGYDPNGIRTPGDR